MAKGNGLSADQVALLNAMINPVPRKKKRNLAWSSDLGECEIGGFLIIPLTTSRLLRAEGLAMMHCVGLYDEMCHKNLARIFSVRDSDNSRVATLSLIWHEDDWYLGQIKGQQNAEVLESEDIYYDGDSMVTVLEPTDLHYVSQEVLRLYRHAWSHQQSGM